MRDTVHVRRRARRRRLVAAGVVLVVLGLGGTAVALRPADARYRTATVTTGDVAQQVSVSATVTSASRTDARFGTSGTVADVAVAVGDVVEAGDVLATLDADELQDSLDEAEEALAEAQQILADDLQAQASGTSSAATATSAAAAASTSTPAAAAASTSTPEVTSTAVGVGAGSSAGASVQPVSETVVDVRAATSTDVDHGADDLELALARAREALAAAQADVLSAQDALLAGYETVEGALLAGTAALEASSEAVTAATGAQGVCAAVLAGETSQEPSDGLSDEDPAGEVMTPEGDLAGCVAALLAAQDALGETDTVQRTTGLAQLALADLVASLDAAVATLADAADALDAAAQALLGDDAPASSPSGATPGSGTGTPGTASSAGEPGAAGEGQELPANTGADDGAGGSTVSGAQEGGSSPAGGGGDASGLGASAAVTAERILADRAAVTAAERQVDIAQAAAAAGVLTAPIAGTVAQVGVVAGASAGTSDTAVTILGDGGYVLSMTLGLADVRSVEVGQAVTVTVPATGGQYTGIVSGVGLLNDSQTSTPSYAVTAMLDATDAELPEGGSASVVIAVASVDDVLVVPTSAVSADGSTRTVRVLDRDEVRTVEVTTGAIGQELTEVTTGLTVGQEVVLADLDQQVAQDGEESSGLTELGGSAGDSGGSPGGFPGGDPPGAGGGLPAGGPPTG